MACMCEEETLRHEMRKIRSAIFFLLREFVCDFLQKYAKMLQNRARK